MTEPYNFSKHLKTVVKPALVAKSFKLKGTAFKRNTDNYVETISFQRSRFNQPDTPSEFYLNLGIESNQLTTSGRIHRPTTFPIPEQYKRFMVENLDTFTFEQRGVAMHAFDPSVKAEIERYADSRRWLYSSESDLIDNFEVVVEFLSSRLDEIYSNISVKIIDAQNFAEGMKLISEDIDKVYLQYIPKHSRWVDV